MNENKDFSNSNANLFYLYVYFFIKKSSADLSDVRVFLNVLMVNVA